MNEYLNIIVNADTKEAVGKLNGLKSLASGLTLFGGVALIKESISAWEEQAEAVTKVKSAVATHLDNMGNHTAKDIENIASATQKMSTYGDEATLVADENFLTFGMTYDQIKAIQEPMADLMQHQKGMHANGSDFLAISNQIGKAWTNGASALAKTGTVTKEQAKQIDAITNKNERLKALTKAIEENYGGQAKAIAKTDVGKIQQMKNDFGDQLELIGQKLIPYLSQIAQFVDKNLDTIMAVGKAFALWKVSSMLFNSLRGVAGLVRGIGRGMKGAFSPKVDLPTTAGKLPSRLSRMDRKVATKTAESTGSKMLKGAGKFAKAGKYAAGYIPLVGWGLDLAFLADDLTGGHVQGAIGSGISSVFNLDGKTVAKNQSKHRKSHSGNAKYGN